jgi:hypothetical protein
LVNKTANLMLRLLTVSFLINFVAVR